jgi:hypothetical protein
LKTESENVKSNVQASVQANVKSNVKSTVKSKDVTVVEGGESGAVERPVGGLDERAAVPVSGQSGLHLLLRLHKERERVTERERI